MDWIDFNDIKPKNMQKVRVLIDDPHFGPKERAQPAVYIHFKDEPAGEFFDANDQHKLCYVAKWMPLQDKQTKDEWISLEDRIPDHHMQIVLVFGIHCCWLPSRSCKKYPDDPIVREAIFMQESLSGKYYFQLSDGCCKIKPTHWMSLPKSPEEK